MDRRSFLKNTSLAALATAGAAVLPTFERKAEAATAIDTSLIAAATAAHAVVIANGTKVVFQSKDWTNLHTKTTAVLANLTAAGFNATIQRAVSTVPASKVTFDKFPNAKAIASVKANGQPGMNQAWINYFLGHVNHTPAFLANGLTLLKGYGPMPFLENWNNTTNLMAGYLAKRFPGPSDPVNGHPPPKTGTGSLFVSPTTPELFMWPPATGGGESGSGFTCADNNMAQAAVSAVLLVLGILTWEVTGPIIVISEAATQALNLAGMGAIVYGLGSNVVCNF